MLTALIIIAIVLTLLYAIVWALRGTLENDPTKDLWD